MRNRPRSTNLLQHLDLGRIVVVGLQLFGLARKHLGAASLNISLRTFKVRAIQQGSRGIVSFERVQRDNRLSGCCADRDTRLMGLPIGRLNWLPTDPECQRHCPQVQLQLRLIERPVRDRGAGAGIR